MQRNNDKHRSLGKKRGGLIRRLGRGAFDLLFYVIICLMAVLSMIPGVKTGMRRILHHVTKGTPWDLKCAHSGEVRESLAFFLFLVLMLSVLMIAWRSVCLTVTEPI